MLDLFAKPPPQRAAHYRQRADELREVGMDKKTARRVAIFSNSLANMTLWQRM
jgi:hypothetical protein